MEEEIKNNSISSFEDKEWDEDGCECGCSGDDCNCDNKEDEGCCSGCANCSNGCCGE